MRTFLAMMLLTTGCKLQQNVILMRVFLTCLEFVLNNAGIPYILNEKFTTLHGKRLKLMNYSEAFWKIFSKKKRLGHNLRFFSSRSCLIKS